MAVASGRGFSMKIERFNPNGLYEPPSYHHVVRASGRTTLWIAGQVSTNADGDVVGVGDFGAQARQIFENLRIALEAGGATFDNVVKMTTLVVNFDRSLIPALNAAREGYIGENLPATTLIGVQALARPEYLLEIEAIAVVD
jgi:enamine deaminase RidA (YjgF/YER057c/UK114 family)